MLDETTGTTYYCFLYSNEELNMDNILEKFEKNDGDFLENLNHALGNKFIASENIVYNHGEIITFKAKSNGKSVLPVTVRIAHD